MLYGGSSQGSSPKEFVVTLASAVESTSALPELPHWETPPADLKAAIREIKAALRARIASSGRSVEEVFAVVERRISEKVAEIEAGKAAGETIWPVIDYADIEAGAGSEAGLAQLSSPGRPVGRGPFQRGQALGRDPDNVESG